MRVAGKSDIKSKFAGHLLDDIQLDGGRILLVVNGELSVPLRDGNNPISQFPNILSNASCLGISLLSRHVLALFPLRE